MRKMITVMTLAIAAFSVLPAQAQPGCYGLPQAVCDQSPVPPPCVKDPNNTDPGAPCASIGSGSDGQVLVAASTFAPDNVGVSVGARVIFQSFDTVQHTATDKACYDDKSKPCKFNILIPIGARANRAAFIVITPSFKPTTEPVTYEFVCSIPSHSVAGSFTVN